LAPQGGISTSLLFSVFESWYVRQHRDVEKLPAAMMADTFATATFANGLVGGELELGLVNEK
jgi:hypothetical protein